MRKFKCEKCSMVHGGFHVCVDLSRPAPEGEGVLTKKKGPMSDEHKARIAEGQRRRWAKRFGNPTY